MHTYKHLWNMFISDDNKESAIRKSAKGKRNHRKVQAVLTNKERVLKDLQNLLDSGDLPPHNYKKRVIYEGKKRNIYVIDYYPWRIIHHMVINILEPIFEPTFIEHTFGCIRGRGQHKGSNCCMKYTQKFKYVLKCDIHKFYPSINQEILSKLIRRKIADKKLLKIIDTIIFSHEIGGIPIGNLPSQLFGNIYMSAFDYHIKHDLRFKNYIRYVDDFVFFSNNKKELREMKKHVESWLFENLKLTLSSNEIFNIKQGVDFLGYRHFPQNYKLLRKSTATRIKRRIRGLESAYTKGKTLKQCISTLQSYIGWLNACNSYNLQKNLNLEQLRRDLTLQECKKGNPTFISGKYKSKNGKILVNAFDLTTKKKNRKIKNVVKVQYTEYTNQTYYFTNARLFNQFKTIDKQKLPMEVTI